MSSAREMVTFNKHQAGFQREKYFTDKLAKYRDCHVLLQFTYVDFINLEIAPDIFEKIDQHLSPLLEQGIFGDVVERAANAGVVPSAHLLMARWFMDLGEWLASPQGANAVREVQLLRQLENTPIDGRTVEGVKLVNLVSVFDMMNEYEAERKKIIDQRDKDVAAVKHGAEKEIEKLRKRYVPVSYFHKPNKATMKRKVWDYYSEECRKKAVVPMKQTFENSKLALRTYCTTVEKQLKIDFCSIEMHKPPLLKYAQEEYKKSCEDKRSLRRFEFLLAAMKGKVVVKENPPSVEVYSDDEDTRETGSERKSVTNLGA